VGKTKKGLPNPTTGVVHPHGCGENWSLSRMARIANGSPPRVWGKLCLRTGQAAGAGFTPTGVGKTHPSN